MKCAYVIGPSSVGKSVLTSKVADVLNIGRLDVDQYRDLRRDWPAFEPLLIAHEQAPIGRLVVDLGAETQTRAAYGLNAFLSARRDRIVCLMDEPETVYRRNRWTNASREFDE